MEPKIVFEDENLLVVDKPAGMIVNKADSAKNFITLQDWVLKNIKIDTKSKSKEYIVDGYDKYDEFISRSGIVHRLDKETSGIILIAKIRKHLYNFKISLRTVRFLRHI